MFRSLFTVSGFTLLSRILGFARDMLIARYIGAGALADVWVAAFRLPNLFRRVFGEGAFNAAFVPMYSRRIGESGEVEADRFARRTISVMFVILMAVFAVCFVFMEPIVKLTNLGFQDDGRLELAVPASRITIGYLVFICLVAALSGILNSRRVFAAPAFSYVVLNIVFVTGLIFVVPRSEDPLTVLCWMVIVSGVLQLAVVLLATLRRKVDLRPRLPKFDPEIKRLGQLMAPGLVSASIQQVNLLVGQTVSSLVIGGSAIIFYADRINQFPLGLIGMGLGTVLLPEISRRLGGGDDEGARRSLCRGIELSLLLALPATIAMIAIAREIMFLFEGGEFTPEAARTGGWVLAMFALGTPSYVLVKVLQPGYFAREDTKTPMRYTIVSAVTNIILVYPMFLWLGPMGCALATSMAGWVNVLLLWAGLRRDGMLALLPGFFSRIARMLSCSVVMGGVAWMLAHFSAPWLLEGGNFASRLGGLMAVSVAGIVVYLALVIATRTYTLAELKKRFARSPRS